MTLNPSRAWFGALLCASALVVGCAQSGPAAKMASASAGPGGSDTDVLTYGMRSAVCRSGRPWSTCRPTRPA